MCFKACRDDIPSTCKFEGFPFLNNCQYIVSNHLDIRICERNWNTTDFCDKETPGMIKHSCQRSCGVCDKGNIL